MDEAEEIIDVMLPSGDKSAEVVQPCKEPLDSAAPAVAAQFAAILTPAPIAPVGRDHLDPAFLMEPAIERVRNRRPCHRCAGRGDGRGNFRPERIP